MLIYIGADHRGFALKESIKAYLAEKGYEIVDVGAKEENKDDDYPDFAAAVASKVSLNYETSRGILLCGSGVGVDIVANKFKMLRSAFAFSNDQVYSARHDDDANVLSIAADFTDEASAKSMVDVFMKTPFGRDERFARRIAKIQEIENSQ